MYANRKREEGVITLSYDDYAVQVSIEDGRLVVGSLASGPGKPVSIGRFRDFVDSLAADLNDLFEEYATEDGE